MKKYFLFLFATAFINCYCQKKVFYYSGGKKHYLKTDSSSLMIQFKDYKECNLKVSAVKKGLGLSDEEIDFLKDERKYIMIKSPKVKKYSIDQICSMSGISHDNIDFISYGRKNKDGDEHVLSLTVRCLLKDEVKLSDIQSYINKYQGEVLEPDKWGVLSIKCKSEESTCNLANTLYESGFVKFSVPDMYLPIKPTSDPYFNNQYYLHNIAQEDYYTYDIDIDAPEAWLVTKGTADIKVAVIGDGVEAHEDMNDANGNSRVLDGFTHDCIFNCKGSPKHDDVGHEQACAGIIAASHNNIGVRGIAPNVKIVPIVIYKKPDDGIWSNDLARSINKAWDDLGADILNISYKWASSCDGANPDVTEAINNAINNGRGGKGCVVVCSAGTDEPSVIYPACLDDVLAVGAVTGYGSHWGLSATGPELDIVAPSHASGIMTIDRMGDPGYTSTNYYWDFGGTSAAAPQVAGVAALILSINPDLTEEEVRCRITSTATDMGDPGRDDIFGHGRLNANAAVSYQSLHLSDETIAGGIHRFESNDIYTSDVTIEGGTVTFQAKNHIQLGVNTKVLLGATVSTEINPSFSCDFGILKSGGINSFNDIENRGSRDYTNFENNSKISIYPNPSNGYIYINIHNIKEAVEISIFDLQGKTIFKKEINGSATIDLSGQQKGLYFIKSVYGNNVETNKIVLK